MIRHLTALVLLPAMALAGVSFDADVRPINRNADGRQRISEILVTVGSRRVAR